MLCAGLAKLLKPFETRVNDMLIAQRRQRYAAAKPLLLLELNDLVQRVGPAAFVGEAQFNRGRSTYVDFRRFM